MMWKFFADTSTQIKLKADDLGLGSNAPTAIQGTQVDGIMNTVYMIAGIVAVIAIIIGAVRYVGANGDSSQIQAAKNTILYAVVGLVVVIMATAITNFVLQNVGK